MAAAGFYWGANNPYLRPVWFKGSCAPKGLNPAKRMLNGDANAAHIIYECLIDTEWGMGASPGAIDTASFETGGDTLYNEAFHLTTLWTGQMEIERFIAEILDHVQATLFVHPRTGLITFKLLRADFDIEDLRLISPENASLSNLQRKLWGETANEVVVTWTNPANESEETVTAHDLANISMQGGTVSSSKNYYMIRNRALAERVAQRDLRAMAEPLAAADADLNRTYWDVMPGEVFLLVWPEKGVVDPIVVRAVGVDYGSPGASTIKVNLLEDIFSLDAADYLDGSDTDWSDPSAEPDAMEHVLLQTAPAFFAAQALDVDGATLSYPEVVTMVIAAQDDPDDHDFELIGQVVQPNGSLIYASLGTRYFVGGGTLTGSIPAETETFITGFTNTTGETPLAGQFIMLGEGDDTDVEITLIKDVLETGWTLTRGVLDTVPRAWAAGTRVWVIDHPADVADITLRADGETVGYRLLTRTSIGILNFDDAPEETLTLSGRPHLPNRPANVSVGGITFGTLNASGLGTIPITWANRNRMSETSQVLAWTDGSVSPEVGQTTSVTLFNGAGTLITTINGLTGTSYNLSTTAFAGATSGKVRLTSKRGGLESIQGHEVSVISISVPPPLASLNFVTSNYQNGASITTSLGSLTGWAYSRAGAAYGYTTAGVPVSFATNVPRITDAGLLIENAATNITTYSRDYGNAAWTKLNQGTGVLPVVSGTLVTAPDGTTTARSIALDRGATDTAGNSSLVLKNDTGLTIGVTYTRSIWLRAATPGVYLMRRVGGGYLLCNVTTTWQRFSATNAATATTDGFQIGLAGGQGSAQSGTLQAWQAQTEAASSASSDIETTTAAVTRPADTATLTVAAGSGTDTLTVTYTGGSATADRSTWGSATVVNLGGTSGGAWVGKAIQTAVLDT